MEGSSVFIWSSKQIMSSGACDTIAECSRIINGLNLSDLIYDEKSNYNIGMKNIRYAASVVNKNCDASAFFILSNLKKEEAIQTSMYHTLTKEIGLGYFIYKNHIVMKFLDIGRSFSNYSDFKPFVELSNSANHYFALKGISDLEMQSNKTCLDLTICSGDIEAYDLSTQPNNMGSNPFSGRMIIVYCSSISIIIVIIVFSYLFLRRIKAKQNRFGK
uniref:Peptidase_C39_2 domain-containing protein n=1 Tax=Rhabditophanes sp. KR3021 TaxID=114890 RepID=A0AC35UIH4_9BILA